MRKNYNKASLWSGIGFALCLQCANADSSIPFTVLWTAYRGRRSRHIKQLLPASNGCSSGNNCELARNDSFTAQRRGQMKPQSSISSKSR